MNEINFEITKKRFEARKFKRSKYINKKWYQFFAHTSPFCYIFYFLEKLKLVYDRPYRVEQTNTIILNGRDDIK